MVILNSLDINMLKTRQGKKYYILIINFIKLTQKIPSKLEAITSESCNNNMLTRKTNSFNQRGSKYHSILFSINRLQSKKTHLIELRHQEKHDNLIIEKRLCDCTQRNPNEIIKNLTNIALTQDKISVLELALKHGVLLRPKNSDMITIAENVWEQIENHNILKDNHISKVRAQTALKSFTYNCFDLDIKHYISDNKMIKVLQNIKEKCLILKPDKGQGIVLIDKTGYYNSMECLFNDTRKFTLLQEDPTLRNLSTVQTYLNTLHKRNEINLEDKNLMRPKFAQIGCAHGSRKIHKGYQDIPPF